MNQINNYKGKKVLVLGAGMSGLNAAKILCKLGARVTISDSKSLSQLPKVRKLASQSNVKLVTGQQRPQMLDHHYDLMIKNPGIPYSNLVVKRAMAIKLPIIVEVEIASELNPGNLVSVTGSNGKTTTVMLITRILNQHFQKGRAYDAGNIGIPASKVVQKMTPNDTMVMEISSFMLLGISSLHPQIAVITNIFSNHLDYHKTRANYVRAKMRITKNQTPNDYLVMNFNTKEFRQLSQLSRAKVIPFCTNGVSKRGAYEENGKLYFRGKYIMNAADIKIHGQYNVENALAAIAVAEIKGCSAKDVSRVLTTFSGASNRNQYVLTYQHRIFFNDSKSTDVESTQAAVDSFHHPEILLLGGLDRGYRMQYFGKLIPSLKKHVKGIVTFGQTKHLMAELAEAASVKNVKVVDTLDQAVPIAYQMSSADDVILLSPANASWDQYPNFEIRGAHYVEDVKKIVHDKEEESK